MSCLSVGSGFVAFGRDGVVMGKKINPPNGGSGVIGVPRSFWGDCLGFFAPVPSSCSSLPAPCGLQEGLHRGRRGSGEYRRVPPLFLAVYSWTAISAAFFSRDLFARALDCSLTSGFNRSLLPSALCLSAHFLHLVFPCSGVSFPHLVQSPILLSSLRRFAS